MVGMPTFDYDTPKVRFIMKPGYQGTQFETESGEPMLVDGNFRAAKVSDGRWCIFIATPYTMRDMGASWQVMIYRVYDAETLEEIPTANVAFEKEV